MAMSLEAAAEVNGNSSKLLDFYESMYHFKKMFPKLDSEFIESVLRSNDGSVDKTIDHLLCITLEFEEENDKSKQAKEEIKFRDTNHSSINSDRDSIISFNDAPPSYTEFIASSARSSIQSKMSTIVPVAKRSTKREAVLIGDLPDDFLRITPTKDQMQRPLTSVSRIQSGCCEDKRDFTDHKAPIKDHNHFNDDYFSLMLQNDEFICELKSDKEFMKALEMEAPTSTRVFPSKPLDDYSATLDKSYSYGRDVVDYNERNILKMKSGFLTNADLRVHLARMGKASKSRFIKLAKAFSKRIKMMNKYFPVAQQYTLSHRGSNEEYYDSHVVQRGTESTYNANDILRREMTTNRSTRRESAYDTYEPDTNCYMDSGLSSGLNSLSINSNNKFQNNDFYSPYSKSNRQKY